MNARVKGTSSEEREMGVVAYSDSSMLALGVRVKDRRFENGLHR